MHYKSVGCNCILLYVARRCTRIVIVCKPSSWTDWILSGWLPSLWGGWFFRRRWSLLRPWCRRSPSSTDFPTPWNKWKPLFPTTRSPRKQPDSSLSLICCKPEKWGRGVLFSSTCGRLTKTPLLPCVDYSYKFREYC